MEQRKTPPLSSLIFHKNSFPGVFIFIACNIFDFLFLTCPVSYFLILQCKDSLESIYFPKIIPETPDFFLSILSLQLGLVGSLRAYVSLSSPIMQQGKLLSESDDSGRNRIIGWKTPQGCVASEGYMHLKDITVHQVPSQRRNQSPLMKVTTTSQAKKIRWGMCSLYIKW